MRLTPFRLTPFVVAPYHYLAHQVDMMVGMVLVVQEGYGGASAEAPYVTTEELRELFGGIGQEPFFTDYDMRGFKINVAMAEMSAPKASPAYDQWFRGISSGTFHPSDMMHSIWSCMSFGCAIMSSNTDSIIFPVCYMYICWLVIQTVCKLSYAALSHSLVVLERGIALVEWWCLCRCSVESVGHLLLHCDFANVDYLFSFFGVNWVL